MFIINNIQLKQFFQECQKDKYIAIDTEFHWTTTYKPTLCLIQIANLNRLVLIDPIEYDLDLLFIKKLLINRRIKKIFHSSRQDIEIFYNLFKIVPNNVFDIQLAVLPLGYENSTSLKKICSDFLQINLKKEFSFLDWRIRPLTTQQIEYACHDVKHLQSIYEIIIRNLKTLKRTSWIKDLHLKLLDISNYKSKEKNAWKKINFLPKTLKEKYLLKELAKRREKIASVYNVTPKSLITNKNLINLCKENKVDHRLEIIENIKNSALKKNLKEFNFDKKIKNNTIKVNKVITYQKIKMVKSVIDRLAKKYKVPANLILNKNEIEYCVLNKKIDLFKGWKKKIFNKKLYNIIVHQVLISFFL